MDHCHKNLYFWYADTIAPRVHKTRQERLSEIEANTLSNDRDEKKQIAELVSSDQQKDAICYADNNEGVQKADSENRFLSKLTQKLDKEYTFTSEIQDWVILK